MAKKNTVTPAKQTKSQILASISADTGLSRKQVAAVLDSLAALAHSHLRTRGSGQFSVPSLGIKMRRVIKPARPARMGVNPFTGQQIMLKAKPAMTSVRASALKALKDAIA